MESEMSDRRSGRTQISYPAENQIVVTASFAAPKELIFRSFTDPALVVQWWGHPFGVLTTCDIDLRVGGEWRYVYQPDGGEAVAFHGTYLEIVPGERLRYLDVLESLGGIEVTNTVTFVEHAGSTTLSILAQHTSQANRDAQAATIALDEAAIEPFDVLEQVATSLR
jgi:uncharacterized protein YndB with AHSA1/START domain